MSSQPRRPHAWFIPSSVANPEEPFICFRCDLAADYDGIDVHCEQDCPETILHLADHHPDCPEHRGPDCPNSSVLAATVLSDPDYDRVPETPDALGLPGGKCQACRATLEPGQKFVTDDGDEYERRYCSETCIIADRVRAQAYREGFTEGKAAAKRIIGRLIDQGTDPGPDDRCCALKITHRHCRFCAGAILAASSARREYETEVCRSCCLAVLEIASGS